MAGTKRGRGRRRTGDGAPHPVDVYVGNRIRQRRMLLGLSQEKLGEALGLSFQQVQKYERGTNRVSASRLFEMSRVLDVPVAFFFEDMPGAARGVPVSEDTADTARQQDTMSKRETLVLVQSYYGITDATTRRRMLDLIKSIRRSAGAQA